MDPLPTPGVEAPRCALCGAVAPEPFFRDRRRDYYRCRRCAMVFVPPSQFLPPAREKAEYDLHRNSPDDVGYRRFLGRLAEPLLARLAPASRGLDFGCGPGPTLSLMLAEAGHSVALYDPFYAPDAGVLELSYDFVTATEVVEHLHRPGAELDRLWGCLRPGGFLGVMTKRVREREAFARWHYKNDPTHVSFFSRETFHWLGARWASRPEFFGADVVILRKPDTLSGRVLEPALAPGTESKGD